MSLTSKLLKGATWALLDKVINQAGNFILLVYLSRSLTPSDFGLIAMLTIFLAVSQSLIDSGFSQSLIQRSHKVTDKDLSTVFYLNLMLSVLIYAGLYFSSSSIALYFNQPELVNLTKILCLIIIVNAFTIVPRAVLTIDVDFKSQSISNTIATIAGATIAIFMVHNNYSYWSIVGMNITKSIANALLITIFSKWRPKCIFSFNSFKSLFSFGSYLLIAGIVATAVQNLYSVLIGKYFNSTQVGYYQQGYNYTDILSSTVTSVIQGVTYPVMTSIQDQHGKLTDTYIKVMGITALVTLPIFWGFMAISEEFVSVFLGSQWMPIIPVLTILSLARMITPLSVINMSILNAKGRSDLFLKVDLCKLPVIALTLFIFIPYGIIGVAIAQVINVFISFFINAHYPGKFFGFGWRKQLKLIGPIMFASVIMYLVLLSVNFPSSIVNLCIKIPLGIMVYTFMCYILKIPSFLHVFNLLKDKLIQTNKSSV